MELDEEDEGSVGGERREWVALKYFGVVFLEDSCDG